MEQLGVGLPLAAIAAFTLLTASIIALRQDNLKRRLAYSTISQLSYIVLGLGLLHGQALTGGLLHIPAHAFMKLTRSSVPARYTSRPTPTTSATWPASGNGCR